MNNELIIIILLAVGMLLIYSAVKDENPANVVRQVFERNE